MPILCLGCTQKFLIKPCLRTSGLVPRLPLLTSFSICHYAHLVPVFVWSFSHVCHKLSVRVCLALIFRRIGNLLYANGMLSHRRNADNMSQYVMCLPLYIFSFIGKIEDDTCTFLRQEAMHRASRNAAGVNEA